MEKKEHSGLYHWLVMIPDRLYPFKSDVEGQWVRGLRSYNATLALYQEKYGLGHYGVKLDAYRQVFHLVGSILYLVAAAFLSHYFLNSTDALYAFLAAAIALISFQEFYIHRRMYQQLWQKGITDWLTWCIPMGVYFFTHFH